MSEYDAVKERARKRVADRVREEMMADRVIDAVRYLRKDGFSDKEIREGLISAIKKGRLSDEEARYAEEWLGEPVDFDEEKEVDEQ